LSKRKAPAEPDQSNNANGVNDDEQWSAVLGVRGFGHLFLPVYTDKKTGERKTASKWWLSWSHDGKRFRECTGTSDAQKAEAFRRNKFAEIWAGRAPWEPQPELTLGGLLERALLKSRLKGRTMHPITEAHARLLGKVLPLSGRRRLSDLDKVARARVAAVKLGTGEHMLANRVTEDVIDAYTAARIGQGYSPATVNRDLAQLKHAFMLAWKAQDQYGNPLVRRVPNFEKLEESDPRRVFPTETVHRAIRAHLPECLQGFIDFVKVTGWRKSEPMKITMDRIDQVDGLILLDPKDVKARKYRDPWPYRGHALLNAVVERQLAMKRKLELQLGIIIPTLFFWPNGRPIKDVDYHWKRACRAAGFPGMRIHDWRRAAARDALKATGDRKLARRLIGVRTDAIFDRYAIVEAGDVLDAVHKLSRVQEDRGASEAQAVLMFEKKSG
jgi:integrase